MKITGDEFVKLILDGDKLVRDKVRYSFTLEISNAKFCNEIGNSIVVEQEELQEMKKALENILEKVSKVCNCQRTFDGFKANKNAAEKISHIIGHEMNMTIHIRFAKYGDIFSMLIFDIEYDLIHSIKKYGKEISILKEELEKKDQEIKILRNKVDFQPDPPGAGYLEAKEEFENLKDRQEK